MRFSVDLDVDRVGDDVPVVGQIAMVIATEGDPNGMVAAGKFTEVVPLAIQPVHLYPINIQVGMSLPFCMILTRALGGKTEVLDFDVGVPT